MSVPLPFLVMPAVPLPLTAASRLTVPAPVTVRRFAPFDNAALSASEPASAPIVAALPSVTAPVKELLSAILRSAPELETPAPFSVSGSALTRTFAWNWSSPPLFTVVPAVIAPSAEACCTLSAPALMIVTPE